MVCVSFSGPQKPCKHKCKCVSQKKDDFFNVEVYDLGSSSSVEESEGTGKYLCSHFFRCKDYLICNQANKCWDL